MSDIGSVTSYAHEGLRLWASPVSRHGPLCPDLICADVRRFLGQPALVPNPYRVMVVPNDEHEERSA